MNIRLAYGKSGLDVTLPDGLKVDVVRPRHVEALADQAGAVRDAMRRRGVIVRAMHPRTIAFCPPLVIENADVDRIVDALAQSLA